MIKHADSRAVLYGYRLIAVRTVWAIVAALTVGVFVVSLPVYFNQQVYAPPSAQRYALAQLGLSSSFYASYLLALNCLIVLAFGFTAVMLFWRGADDWVVIFISTALLTTGAAISPTLDTLMSLRPGWQLAVTLLRGLAICSALLVFYIFPDGKFVPRWTRLVTLVWLGWLLTWVLFPAESANPEELPLMLRFLTHLVTATAETISAARYYLHVASFLLVLLAWLGSGVLIQAYRYNRVSTPTQRQQTKWVVLGLAAAVVGFFGYRLPLLVVPALHQPGVVNLTYTLIGEPISTLLLLLLPAALSASVLRYRLWDIDPLIHRTLVYGTLTGTLAALYLGGVLLLERILRLFTQQRSDIAIVISTLVIAALVQPLRRRLQDFIDRRFYRERVDFRRAVTRFSREVRTLIDLPELLDVLVSRTTDLLHIGYGAVVLRDSDGTLHQAAAHNLPPDQNTALSLDAHTLGRLWQNLAVPLKERSAFALLVPLIAPRLEGNELVGVLALGSRLSGQGYSREDMGLLTGLADQAGTAIYVARLIREKQKEARLREEAEHLLDAHRKSPIGQAEVLANRLIAAPQGALAELHHLTQAAERDADLASLVDNLPRVLHTLGAEELAHLAEGFNYLVISHVEHDLLPVGLRVLTTHLAEPAAADWEHAQEALTAYQLCQEALAAQSIAQITQLLPTLQTLQGCEVVSSPAPTTDLVCALTGLRTAAEALHAYERLDAPEDKLAYLASAVERLRRIDYLAHSALEGADLNIVLRVTENWLNVVTRTIGDLQTRAQIVCQLLTRRTVQDRRQGQATTLVLVLRNAGRGAALNVLVTLAPSPDYTATNETARVERLAPGEETQVELQARLHLAKGASQFRAHFVIHYTDPRGAEQVESFADLVHLLTVETDFKFIPNPYVVGTPLEGGSPLFFGREDVVAFVQENLAALHRNNLVLISQRRTGKTSLLKQLPARLGDEYLPVYLDGQALGLDPGLANFFLTLATEIAFALEDRGLNVEMPEADQFAQNPASLFERDFLPRVRDGIGQRHLLIMFDEFEELETAVRRGNLDPSIFGFLRHLIQHTGQLSVIFCGTHRLEELAADYWSVLFNISLYRHVGFLEKGEALRLIQEPVAPYGMRYDDLALDKVWQVTAGHPYFLQLLCHSLVTRHNKSKHNYVTVADVNAALEEILASGEAHFVYLWAEATAEERLALATLSRMTSLTGRATPVQVTDYLHERGVEVERRAVAEALHRLALRDILVEVKERDLDTGEVYSWRLGLLGMWVERYKSLGRVVDEARGGTR